jgi:RNA recognition motif-containing protein
VNEIDLENLFSKYGKILNVTIKSKKDKFAFIEFEDLRDA